VAAAARLALRDWERLAEDHALARDLATALEDRLPGVVAAPPQTNMVQVAGERLPGGPEPFREALPLELLEGAGHCPHDEQPEAFNTAVLAWLGEQGLARGAAAPPSFGVGT